MKKTIRDMRPVYVVGIGLHKYQRMSDATFLDLDHIEILKGPQSTFFGNNAIAGAFNLTTKQPGSTVEGYARALYGMFGDRTVEAASSVPLTDQLSVRLAAHYDGWPACGAHWRRRFADAKS